MWSDIFAEVLKRVAQKATPEIREELKRHLDEWQDRCEATPNPWDDLLVFIVRGIVGL